MLEKLLPQIKELFPTDSIVNLHDKIFSLNFNDIKRSDIIDLNQWIKDHSDIYAMEKVILFHGTNSEHKILEQGIKKTTSKSKRSFQSRHGFVYLSCYPESAKSFGELAYPQKDISVYAVLVPVKDLCSDLDQLKNKRMWSNGESDVIKSTVADSLIYGSGARVKRDIHNYEVKDITSLLNSL